eukprot:CAMPEP_0194348476 /NCGR_PEP_ID=MMETSP0171-20130528/106555_1 /TAXON_ID=218684 /ORGANISM="Corethron pennatum, Strain L29A3" /LENGTH=738 /DNA_ID=CAMNT_0039115821 /DNA_START=242 /DNA_END=2458 /DNA_ORIENTATION=+
MVSIGAVRGLFTFIIITFTIMVTYYTVRRDAHNITGVEHAVAEGITKYTSTVEKLSSSSSAHTANTSSSVHTTNTKDDPLQHSPPEHAPPQNVQSQNDPPRRPPPATPRRQNIVLVIIDDLGIGDLKCYGSSFHETPNIDALAAEGVRFTSAYAAHPKCGPARLALFSGVYPARMGSPVSGHELEKYGMPNAFKCQKKMGDYKMRLPLERTSMGGAFKLNGYRTGYHGKWHFGDASGRGSPLDHGFEVSIGATHKGSVQSHFAPYTNPDHIKQVPPPPMSEPRPDGTYMADHLTDETIGTIKKFKNDPFLVVLAHYAVHTPIEAPEDLVDPYEKKRNLLDETDQFTHDHNAVYRTSQDHATYGGMMTAVDNSVGRVMQALKDMGLDQNTTVVFTSDNGGLASSIKEKNMPDIPTTNHPYRHGKTWLYEGGVRVPLIVHAPDRKRVEGGESAFLTTGTDVYPTLLDLAGLPLRPKDHVDGISFAEAVTTKRDGSVRKKPLFWHFGILDQNTTVVFTSDNGGQASHATPSNVAAIPTSNAPYRHGKTWLYEGGVRVPLIVHDPDAPVSTRGRESDFVTVGTDMYPTLLDLAGLPLRPKDHVDGISTTDAIFAPTVGNATAIRDSPLFWHFSYNKPEHTKGKGGGLSLNKGQVQCSAVMDGKWKLIDFWDEGKDGRKELYNVHTDPYETKNLAQTHPEVRKRLFQKLRFWRHNWVKESDYIDLECKEEKMATLGREGERKD